MCMPGGIINSDPTTYRGVVVEPHTIMKTYFGRVFIEQLIAVAGADAIIAAAGNDAVICPYFEKTIRDHATELGIKMRKDYFDSKSYERYREATSQ